MNVLSAMDVGMFVLPAIAVMGRATANILTKTGLGFVNTAINVMVDVKLMSNVPVVNMQGRLAIVFLCRKTNFLQSCLCRTETLSSIPRSLGTPLVGEKDSW